MAVMDTSTTTIASAEAEPRQQRSFFLEFTAVFAVVAIVLIVGVGVGLSSFLASDIRTKTLDDVTTSVQEVTAGALSANLTEEHLRAPMTGETLASFDGFVRESILSPRTVRVNVWNADGTIVYSTHEPLIGHAEPANEGLVAALSGDTAAEVEKVNGVTGADIPGYDRVVEVYTPITLAGSSEIAGAFEIYRDYGPIAAHIQNVQRSVFVSIAVALGLLYLVLVFLVRRGSNTIKRQHADLRHRSDELKNSYESIVAVLCAALDLRDNVTHGHARRVSEMASVVAWQMGLRKDQVRQVEKAAILHDVGKIGVADAILSKPGPLTESEWAELKRHPELGFRMLEGIDFLRDVAEIVHCHHERYDGSGYPRGLKGDEIPLGARIFAVVDAYDAMTSHRPYRKAMPHNKAVEEIIQNSGSQFDPDVVKAFMEAERRGLLEEEPAPRNASPEPAAPAVD